MADDGEVEFWLQRQSSHIPTSALGYKQTTRPRRRNVRFTPDSRHSSADHFARRGGGAGDIRRRRPAFPGWCFPVSAGRARRRKTGPPAVGVISDTIRLVRTPPTQRRQSARRAGLASAAFALPKSITPALQSRPAPEPGPEQEAAPRVPRISRRRGLAQDAPGLPPSGLASRDRSS